LALAGRTGVEHGLHFRREQRPSEELDFINAAQPGRVAAQDRSGDLEGRRTAQAAQTGSGVEDPSRDAINVELASVSLGAGDGHGDEVPLVVRWDRACVT